MQACLPLLVVLFIGESSYASAMQQATVDLSSSDTTYFDSAMVTRCVGSGHASTTMRADWQRQLKSFKKDIGTEYVRFHGLLDDDMSVVVSREGGLTYNFVNIFNIFDFLLSIGIRPVVELSFMPTLLAEDPDATVFYYRGGISPPHDYSEWRDLISTLIASLIDRYGKDEVRSWYFEVWNEPNCGFFYEGDCCGEGCGNQSAYLDMFINTYSAVKSVDGQLRVGGPATAELSWLPDFISNATVAGVIPDFVTSHLYPTDPVVNAGRNGFTNLISEAAQSIATASEDSGLDSALSLLLTEFNCGLSINCADAPMAGSFLVHHLLTGQHLSTSVPIQSYWTFSDIFEEQGQSPEEFSQAFGAQSIHGVPKPVYRTMELLRRLWPNALYVDGLSEESTLDVVVTRNGSQVEVLMTNYPNLTNSHQEFPVEDIQLQFIGSAKPSRVDMRVVDESRSNPLPLYTSAGSPVYPNATFLQQLREASSIKAIPANVSGDDGHWAIDAALGPYAVVSLSFSSEPETDEK